MGSHMHMGLPYVYWASQEPIHYMRMGHPVRIRAIPYVYGAKYANGAKKLGDLMIKIKETTQMPIILHKC